MATPTTIRIPKDLLKEIGKLVQELQLDRSYARSTSLRTGWYSGSVIIR